MPSEIGAVHHRVSDVDAAVRFYDAALGLTPRFRDGARYAALDATSTTLALVDAEEPLVTDHPAAAFRTADVQAALDAVVAAGGTVVSPVVEGGHEVSAVARDPWGNAFILYARRRDDTRTSGAPDGHGGPAPAGPPLDITDDDYLH